MTQLTYKEAFDPYHTMYRLLRLRSGLDSFEAMPVDGVRILDFFLLFPFRLSSFSFKQKHNDCRKIAKSYKHLIPYGDQPDDWLLFGKMELIQKASMSTLAKLGFLDRHQLERGIVSFTKVATPDEIGDRISEKNEQDFELLSALQVLATEYELTGADGLKRRSGLMEHRYDAA